MILYRTTSDIIHDAVYDLIYDIIASAGFAIQPYASYVGHLRTGGGIWDGNLCMYVVDWRENAQPPRVGSCASGWSTPLRRYIR